MALEPNQIFSWGVLVVVVVNVADNVVVVVVAKVVDGNIVVVVFVRVVVESEL